MTLFNSTWSFSFEFVSWYSLYRRRDSAFPKLWNCFSLFQVNKFFILQKLSQDCFKQEVLQKGMAPSTFHTFWVRNANLYSCSRGTLWSQTYSSRNHETKIYHQQKQDINCKCLSRTIFTKIKCIFQDIKKRRLFVRCLRFGICILTNKCEKTKTKRCRNLIIVLQFDKIRCDFYYNQWPFSCITQEYFDGFSDLFFGQEKKIVILKATHCR